MGEKYQIFLKWLYSHLDILLAGFFTRIIRKSDKCSLFPRIFLLFTRFALSRTFFLLACFSSHASKKRICEEKKNLWNPLCLCFFAASSKIRVASFLFSDDFNKTFLLPLVSLLSYQPGFRPRKTVWRAKQKSISER